MFLIRLRSQFPQQYKGNEFVLDPFTRTKGVCFLHWWLMLDNSGGGGSVLKRNIKTRKNRFHLKQPKLRWANFSANFHVTLYAEVYRLTNSRLHVINCRHSTQTPVYPVAPFATPTATMGRYHHVYFVWTATCIYIRIFCFQPRPRSILIFVGI